MKGRGRYELWMSRGEWGGWEEGWNREKRWLDKVGWGEVRGRGE